MSPRLILLAATVIGLPLALSTLFFVWPALAFIGYLVAAIWIGEWLLRAAGRRQRAERPYLAAVVGLQWGAVLAMDQTVNILVAFATRYGSTEQIAGFIGERLRAEGLQPTVEPVESIHHVDPYDAFIIGSGVYIGHWLKPGVQFVRKHRDVLATRPTWLFSSGPLGPQSTKAHEATGAGSAEPAELTEFREAIRPRDHQVFDGALDPTRLGLGHKLIRAMPAGKALLPAGDFRDWPAIEAWAADIATQLRAERIAVTG